MKLQIKNIGQIREAEIDLNKDFIILCGANNTGKTYLAYTVYGLYRYAQEKFANQRIIDNIQEEIDAVLLNGNAEIDLQEVLHSKKDIIFNQLEEKYINYLPTVFSTVTDFFEKTSISLIIQSDELNNNLLNASITHNLGLGSTQVILKKEKGSFKLNIVLLKEKQEDIFPNDLISYIINQNVLNVILETIFSNVHISTAERLAINLFSKELSEKRHKLIDQMLELNKKENPMNFLEDQVSRYSLPIRDSLNFAERLDVLQKRKSPYVLLADQIEKTILGGKMKVSKTGEVQFIPTESKLNLGIHLTASVVKSLASLIFYCRHVAQPNDFLIIDEPELNLHPDNQRKIARVLAQMVNAGIKIMISTHSDYLMRELNNLMMLNVQGNDKKVNQLIKKYGYQKDQLLDYRKVGVYLFTDEVKALEVTETGFEVKGIDEEINRLNESAHEIFFTLHDND